MTDKDKLSSDLSFMHIMLLYDFMQPIDYIADITAKSIEGRKDAAIRRYRSDWLFHTRVDEIVAYTMQLIEEAEGLNT